MTSPKLSVIPTANQEALSNKLMEELRAVMNKPEYGNVYYSTNIGVLEMLKMELYEGITP